MAPPSAKHQLFVHFFRGYQANIYVLWEFELSSPTGLMIEITRAGNYAHNMHVSSRYRSSDEALAEGKALVEHYVKFDFSFRKPAI